MKFSVNLRYSECYCKAINETVEQKGTYMHDLYDTVKIYTETVNRLFNPKQDSLAH